MMNGLSLKVKILFSIVTLTIASLGIFSYLTFSSYKKDKLAFIYDHLASETQSKSTLFTSTIEQYDFFLGSIISSLDFNTRVLPSGTTKFLAGNSNLMGLYIYLPEKGDMTSLYESSSWTMMNISKSKIAELPAGFSLLDRKSGHFIIKKTLSVADGYAAVVFRNPELINVLKSGKGRFNFLYKEGAVFSKDEFQLGGEDMKSLISQFQGSKSSLGLFESTVKGESYFVSFAKLPFQKMVLVNLIAEKKVLLIQKVMLRQVITFLVLLGSISLLVGTLSARWLTIHLDDLTLAAQELENQNFDHVVEVNSKDELGTLGQAFNSMSGRIRSLLEELQIYNTQLEEKVEERTRELQDLSNIQHAMLNSLGQGFVIVNKNYDVLPVYSKVAEDMFEMVPNEGAPGDIMGVKPEDAAPFKEFFDLVFNQVIDFDDMVKMNPDFRSNSKDQKIQLTYAPIRSTETNDLEYVLIIGTDKTTELENIEKFNREWNFSQMMMKIVGNRYSLNKVIKESLGMLDSALDALESGKAYAVKDVQRYIHTIKGSFSYFNISNITALSHSFESYLEPYFKEESCSDEIKMTALFKIQEIQIAIENFIQEYDQLIQYKSSNTHKAIPYSTLEKFSKVLSVESPALLETFTQEFNRVEIQPFFQMYPTVIQDLGIKLNKKIKFIIEGANQSLPEDNWEEVFGQFIHFVRNSADHGIESESDRLEKGKKGEGLIKFSFAQDSDKLRITLSDDGQGIDWKKIAAKDPTVQNEADAIDRIMAGGVSSKDEVSDTSGRGVGVSAIFAVVEKWHGHIEVKNKLDKGLTLVIEIPFRQKVQHLKVA